MKFGDTLYQRSVPKWASYNVNYNELKHLIKTRTSTGTAVPVSIPGPGVGRWQQLDDDLYCVVRDQYDNVALFLRSKQGEIERRLTHLEKQVGIAQRAVADNALGRPILQARKYQRLIKDAEAIGDEIESLSRFAGVQKTAFRKILKKYRKWTGSISLQTRLDVEVFSSGALQVDYAEYLQRLASQSKTISGELAAPMLTGHTGSRLSDRPDTASTRERSNAPTINTAADGTPLEFDAALASIPYGEVAGSAFYWIHPDNSEEAEVMLLRHMRMLGSKPSLSRKSSTASFSLHDRDTSPGVANASSVHAVFYDNLQRFTQDVRVLRPSSIALNARWAADSEAIVTLSSLSPRSAEMETIKLRRKDIAGALQRGSEHVSESVPRGLAIKKIQNYLAEHRDVKPLAHVTSARSRYAGITNSSEVGTWATLDSSISMAPVDSSLLGQAEPVLEAGQAFPYLVLHIRWEFSRMPEVVRAFDSSHLVERVQDFTLENAAVFSVVPDLEQPKWRQLLEKDIRKVPSLMRKKETPTIGRSRTGDLPPIPVSSGPSSTEGPSESVFSAVQRLSSATSDDLSPTVSTRDVTSQVKIKKIAETIDRKKKKRARIAAPPREETSPRGYWNEFDDGDSDTNIQETYAIYVDPNEPNFPGAETVSKVFGAMYESFSKGKSRMISWLPMNSKNDESQASERTPLLFGSRQDGRKASDADIESSSSETDEFMTKAPIHKAHERVMSQSVHRRMVSGTSSMYRPHQPLTPRQKALERTLFQFYTGLIAVSYVFLSMSVILLGTGRRKAALEVDAGVIGGVIAAEMCAAIAGMLLCMRRRRLSVLHWGVMGVNIATIVVVGVAILSLMFVGR